MSSAAERYERVHGILAGARGLSGAELHAFLDAECAADAALRAEVLELLDVAGEEATDPFGEAEIQRARVALEALVDRSSDSEGSWLPESIGGYRIVRQIGLGGMGIVYEAEQESPRRSVAIKLLHPIHATKDRLRRFRQEAELLGRLQHPGIAQIFESGSYDVGRGNQPFIAMELVEGVDIRAYCQRQELPVADRIELLARVADAVQYAHEHGVVHRDLKPDNVLVNPEGQPRILDFGIARAIDQTTALSTVLTEKGQLVGTLGYMAPEQLSGVTEDVTPGVDVFALGVLGYELLTGQLPRSVEGLPVSKAIAALSDTDAPLAGRFVPELRGDVETILGMALEQDPKRRYTSAAAFAGDLRRFLGDRPIEARPPSRSYLMRKFARRHRGLVVGAITTIVVAVIGAVIAIAFALEANQRAATLQRQAYLAEISAAKSSIEQHDYALAKRHLVSTPAEHRGWEHDHLRARLSHHDLAVRLSNPVIAGPEFDAAGTRFYIATLDGMVRCLDASSGAEVRAFRPSPPIAPKNGRAIALHGGGRRFAYCSADGGIHLGDLTTERAEEIDRVAAAGNISVLAVGPEGRRVIYSFGNETKLWDGKAARVLTDYAWSLGTFSHAGDRVALVRGNVVDTVALPSGKRLQRHRNWIDTLGSAAFSPDDNLLALGGAYRNIFLHDGQSLTQLHRLTGHFKQSCRVAWAHDGTVLVSATDATVRVWRLDPVRTVRIAASAAPIGGRVVFTPDDRFLWTAGEVLQRFPVADPYVLRGHTSYVYELEFSPDGRKLASYGMDEKVLRVWDVQTGACTVLHGPEELDRGLGRALSMGFTSDSRGIVALCHQNRILEWNALAAGSVPSSVETVVRREEIHPRFLAAMGRSVFVGVNSIAVSPDRRMVAQAGPDGVVRLHHVRIDPDLWSLFELARLAGAQPAVGELRGHEGQVYSVAFSPDGTRIVTGGNDGTVRLWDARTFEQVLELRGHEQYVHDVAFSPDGTVIASCSGDGTVRLWDSLPLVERRAR